LRKVKEDVEREWEGKLGEEKRKKEEMEVWAKELERELEKEKGVSVVVSERVRRCWLILECYGISFVKSSKRNDAH
jgi:hypothetical protein